MKVKLHIDIETYSSEDLRKSGMYKYCDSPDFEILMVAYSFGNGPVHIIDLACGEEIPDSVIRAMKNPEIIKVAHNAAFERNCFEVYGIHTEIDQWECTLVQAAYCGFPLSLGMASKAMGLEEGKDTKGKALINYFCKPIKPTKANGGRTRNLPHHDEEKWEDFKDYCVQDVVTEKAIDTALAEYPVPDFEKQIYILDQEINDRGILVDMDFVDSARNIDFHRAKRIFADMKEISGLENPNSPAQLKAWLSEAMGEDIPSLAKDYIPPLIEKAESEAVKKLLKLRMRASKSSIKKYVAMENCAGSDNRARGLFQFYGANRTGRWAGRLIQLQNLPRINMKGIEQAKEIVSMGDPEIADMVYDNISSVLSQLIRTAFIAKEGYTFCVADFSAIEARVIAWMAGEQWRIDVFNSHGKIYEASAAMMFGVPIEEVTKENGLRQKGKVAELALGYQGSLGAMVQMGAEKMGLSELEMKDLVTKWRAKNPNIKRFWYDTERYALKAIKNKGKIISSDLLEFLHDGRFLRIKLPSGKELFYPGAELTINKFDRQSIRYKGIDQKINKWVWIDTYGGKLVENIVQAVSRDILAYSMLRIKDEGFDIVMHVHDEAVAEIPDNASAPGRLKEMCKIMGEKIPWASGLPLNAEGYLSPFYKKD